MSDAVSARLRGNATRIATALVTGTWLVALFSGQGWWLPFMLFGYVVAVPLVAILFGDREDVAEWWGDEAASVVEDDREDPIETLRARYARGELTDEAFERKFDRLLEAEAVSESQETREGGERVPGPEPGALGSGTETDGNAETETETETE